MEREEMAPIAKMHIITEPCTYSTRTVLTHTHTKMSSFRELERERRHLMLQHVVDHTREDMMFTIVSERRSAI